MNHLVLTDFFSAGKPLRIALSKRLGIGQLTDKHPLLHRHFEASASENQHLLSEPIPCSRVTIDVFKVGNALKNLADVDDATLRLRPSGSVDAYISLSSQMTLEVDDVLEKLTYVLSGYELPDRVYPVYGALPRDISGDYDYSAMEKAALDNTAIDLSERQLLVRDIVADLLNIDATHIREDSDFFLLGGNSLLLGKLAYLVRKQSGVDIGVTQIFSASTIAGIASLIDEWDKQGIWGKTRDEKGNDSASSNTAFSEEYDYEQDLEFAQSKKRKQDHPLVLIVQALPFLFFYPFKTALTCGFKFSSPLS